MHTYRVSNKSEHQQFTVKAPNPSIAIQKALGIYSMLEAQVLGWQVRKERDKQIKH